VGAVLGVRFALSDVASLLARPAAELLAPLDEALAADVLSGYGDRLGFTQELFWRCVLLTLPESARVALQREAAAQHVSVDFTGMVPARLDHGRELRAIAPVAASRNGSSIQLAEPMSSAVPRASAAPSPSAAAPEAAPGWTVLNELENEVALLVSQGLTNQQIARQMFRSPHTVNYHLRQIFRKLDIHSRVELARLTLLHRSAAEAAGDDAVDAG